jgi:acyl-CoA synthetase (AMP-forming)/AMP-acid ligase II
LADSLRFQFGLTSEDRFAVMATNSHEFLELYHAGFLGAGVITR